MSTPPLPAKAHARPAHMARRVAILQGLVFWLTFAAVCASAVFLGGNRPAVWVALSLAVIALHVVQIACDLAAPPDATDRSFLVSLAVLWALVIAWALVQGLPAAVAGWSHPAWSAAGVAPGRITPDPAATAQAALRMIAYGGIFWIAYRAGTDRRRARAFVSMVALWVLVTALYGLIALGAGVNPITGPSAYPGTVTSSFVNRNAYALYAGFGLLAAMAGVGLIVRRELSQLPPMMEAAPLRVIEVVITRGWVLALAAIVLAAAILLTESRGGTVASGVGLCLLIALLAYRRGATTRVLTWSIALPAMLLVAGLWVSAQVTAQEAQGLTGRLAFEDPSRDARWSVYAAVLGAIAARPLIGHGFGAFQDGFRPFATAELGKTEWDFAHNTYLQTAFELGLPAAALMFLALGLIGLRLMRGVATRSRGRALPALALSALVAAGLHGLVDFSPEMPATAALLAMILGVGAAQSNRPRRPPRPDQFT